MLGGYGGFGKRPYFLLLFFNPFLRITVSLKACKVVTSDFYQIQVKLIFQIVLQKTGIAIPRGLALRMHQRSSRIDHILAGQLESS